MSERDPIARYLLKLNRALWLRPWAHPRYRRRFVQDVREHLEDAVERHVADGLDHSEAQQHALKQTGPPEVVVRARGDLGQMPREMRIGLWMVVALTGSLVAVATATLVDRKHPVAIAPFRGDCGSHDAEKARSASAGNLQGQRIVVAGVWSANERQSFAKVIERFNKKTGAGASIQYESQTRNIAPKLQKRLNTGCPPDVALLPQPGLLKSLANAGDLKRIEKVAGNLVDSNYAPVWRRLGSVDKKLYGVWFKAANKSTFWYRQTTLRNAGLAPPKTWEELKRVADRLSDRNVVPFSVAGADGWTLTDWFENVYLRSAGRAMYEQLAEHKISWTHPSVKRALRRLAEILGKQHWLAGGTDGALNTNFTTSVHQVFSDPAQAAMVYEGDFVASEIAARANDTARKDAQFFAFPSVDGSKPAIVAGGDVAVLLTNNPAARKLIHFLATPEAAEPWAKAGGFVSPNNKLDIDAYADSTTKESARALVNARTISFDLSDQQPPTFGATEGQGMWQIFQDYLKDPTNIDIVTQRLENTASAAFDCQRRLPQC